MGFTDGDASAVKYYTTPCHDDPGNGRTSGNANTGLVGHSSITHTNAYTITIGRSNGVGNAATDNGGAGSIVNPAANTRGGDIRSAGYAISGADGSAYYGSAADENTATSYSDTVAINDAVTHTGDEHVWFTGVGFPYANPSAFDECASSEIIDHANSRTGGNASTDHVDSAYTAHAGARNSTFVRTDAAGNSVVNDGGADRVGDPVANTGYRVFESAGNALTGTDGRFSDSSAAPRNAVAWYSDSDAVNDTGTDAITDDVRCTCIYFADADTRAFDQSSRSCNIGPDNVRTGSSNTTGHVKSTNIEHDGAHTSAVGRHNAARNSVTDNSDADRVDDPVADTRAGDIRSAGNAIAGADERSFDGSAEVGNDTTSYGINRSINDAATHTRIERVYVTGIDFSNVNTSAFDECARSGNDDPGNGRTGGHKSTGHVEATDIEHAVTHTSAFVRRNNDENTVSDTGGAGRVGYPAADTRAGYIGGACKAISGADGRFSNGNTALAHIFTGDRCTGIINSTAPYAITKRVWLTRMGFTDGDASAVKYYTTPCHDDPGNGRTSGNANTGLVGHSSITHTNAYTITIGRSNGVGNAATDNGGAGSIVNPAANTRGGDIRSAGYAISGADGSAYYGSAADENTATSYSDTVAINDAVTHTGDEHVWFTGVGFPYANPSAFDECASSEIIDHANSRTGGNASTDHVDSAYTAHAGARNSTFVRTDAAGNSVVNDGGADRVGDPVANTGYRVFESAGNALTGTDGRFSDSSAAPRNAVAWYSDSDAVNDTGTDAITDDVRCTCIYFADADTRAFDQSSRSCNIGPDNVRTGSSNTTGHVKSTNIEHDGAHTSAVGRHNAARNSVTDNSDADRVDDPVADTRAGDIRSAGNAIAGADERSFDGSAEVGNDTTSYGINRSINDAATHTRIERVYVTGIDFSNVNTSAFDECARSGNDDPGNGRTGGHKSTGHVEATDIEHAVTHTSAFVRRNNDENTVSDTGGAGRVGYPAADTRAGYIGGACKAISGADGRFSNGNTALAHIFTGDRCTGIINSTAPYAITKRVWLTRMGFTDGDASAVKYYTTPCHDDPGNGRTSGNANTGLVGHSSITHTNAYTITIGRSNGVGNAATDNGGAGSIVNPAANTRGGDIRSAGYAISGADGSAYYGSAADENTATSYSDTVAINDAVTHTGDEHVWFTGVGFPYANPSAFDECASSEIIDHANSRTGGNASTDHVDSAYTAHAGARNSTFVRTDAAGNSVVNDGGADRVGDPVANTGYRVFESAGNALTGTDGRFSDSSAAPRNAVAWYSDSDAVNDTGTDAITDDVRCTCIYFADADTRAFDQSSRSCNIGPDNVRTGSSNTTGHVKSTNIEHDGAHTSAVGRHNAARNSVTDNSDADRVDDPVADTRAGDIRSAGNAIAGADERSFDGSAEVGNDTTSYGINRSINDAATHTRIERVYVTGIDFSNVNTSAFDECARSGNDDPGNGRTGGHKSTGHVEATDIEHAVTHTSAFVRRNNDENTVSDTGGAGRVGYPAADTRAGYIGGACKAISGADGRFSNGNTALAHIFTGDRCTGIINSTAPYAITKRVWLTRMGFTDGDASAVKYYTTPCHDDPGNGRTSGNANTGLVGHSSITHTNAYTITIGRSNGVGNAATDNGGAGSIVNPAANTRGGDIRSAGYAISGADGSAYYGSAADENTATSYSDTVAINDAVTHTGDEHVWFTGVGFPYANPSAFDECASSEIIDHANSRTGGNASTDHVDSAYTAHAGARNSTFVRTDAAGNSVVNDGGADRVGDPVANTGYRVFESAGNALTGTDGRFSDSSAAPRNAVAWYSDSDAVNDTGTDAITDDVRCTCIYFADADTRAFDQSSRSCNIGPDNVRTGSSNTTGHVKSTNIEHDGAHTSAVGRHNAARNSVTDNSDADRVDDPVADTGAGDIRSAGNAIAGADERSFDGSAEVGNDTTSYGINRSINDAATHTRIERVYVTGIDFSNVNTSAFDECARSGNDDPGNGRTGGHKSTGHVEATDIEHAVTHTSAFVRRNNDENTVSDTGGAGRVGYPAANTRVGHFRSAGNAVAGANGEAFDGSAPTRITIARDKCTGTINSTATHVSGEDF
eukprot:jgi/Undpi1/9700/HiC_scaffold_27.g12156.m1